MTYDYSINRVLISSLLSKGPALSKPLPQTILGVDPGSRLTGFALLRSRCSKPMLPGDFIVVTAGVLRADGDLPHRERLGLLHVALYELAVELKPDICVLEKAFFGDNASSALKLGELRGAYIAACARCSIPVEEITPAEVKKSITGNGRADKVMVEMALKTLLGFDRGTLPHDVTDALAIGLCFGLQLTRKWPESLAVPIKSGTRAHGMAGRS